MAKDYSAKPTDVENFTQSSEVNLPQNFQDYSEFLPNINRSESLQRFFGATVNQLLSSGSTQSIDAYWGRLAGRNYNPDAEQFQFDSDAFRQNYQFFPGTVSKSGNETQQTVSYPNWLRRLESLGSDLDNHDRLFSEPGYVLDLPINADMFLNYSSYYWLEGSIPLVTIEATVTNPIDIDLIVGRSQYTTTALSNYKTVEFVSGLRVKFTGNFVTSTSGNYFVDYTYYVENVGGRGGIKLIPIEDSDGNDLFPSLTPYEIKPKEGWDTVLWDTTPWDGDAAFAEYNVDTTTVRDDLDLNKSYIVMERWSQDKNPWARSNKWFSIYALQVATEYNNLDLEAYQNSRTRATRPIIEFRANMELYNTCNNFREQVDFVFSLDQVTEMLIGNEEFFVDSENAIQNGDVILVAREEPGGIQIIDFNNDFNNDYDAADGISGPYSTSFSSSFATGAQRIYYGDTFVVEGVGTNISLVPYTKTMNILNISQANPGIVTVADTSVVINGTPVTINGVVGMTEVNGNTYTATIINETTFSIDVVTTGFTEYSSGGLLTYNPEYNNEDWILVKKGTERGFVYCKKDGTWFLAQNKETRGSSPLFNLYDQFKTPLTSFENTDFSGEKIFGYEISVMGRFDRELGIRPTFTNQGSFNDYKFEWTLSNQRYKKNITINNSEEIRGYYFWRDWVKDEYLNGWSNIRESQRVPVIQTIVANGINLPVFELGTENFQRTTEYTVEKNGDNFRWYSHSYLDIAPVGYNNPELIWKFSTDYTIHTLVPDTSNSIEFVSPLGTTNNITTTVIDETLTMINVNSAYEFDKVIYRAESSTNVKGEIHLSNFNQGRYTIIHNGSYLIEGVDYTVTGSLLTVTKTEVEENDVFELRYVADAELENAVYDVAPIHFYNSENNPFTGAGYDDLISHFRRQLVSLPGFEGNVSGVNNYHKTLRLHTYDGLIRQQIFETKKIQYLLDQELINPVRALKTISRDYSQFKRTFQNKVRQLWNTHSWISIRDLVDRAINDINLGKSDEFRYAHSDMLYSKQAKTVTYPIDPFIPASIYELPEVVNNYGDSQNHVQVWMTEYVAEKNKTLERPLIKGIDYTIDGQYVVLASIPNVNGNVVNGVNNVVNGLDNVILDDVAVTDKLVIRWYDYRQLSHVPFSAVKLGFFRPTQVEVVDGELIGHDGSRYMLTSTDLIDMSSVEFDVIGAALLDFELRVFNNLVDEHFRSENSYDYEMFDLFPNAFGEFAYRMVDINSRLDDWYNRWIIENETVVSSIVEPEYDELDEFTWNYSTVEPNLGSWRLLYTYHFGTDRPHTHPWEMLGHRVKPDWWDTNYSWTAGTKRFALINALKFGNTGTKTSPNHIDYRFARSNYDWESNTLVSSDGNKTLSGPVTAGIASNPLPVDASKRFVFGEWGEVENRWRKSSEYLFALSEVFLQLKPYRTHDLFWMLRRWNINNVVTQEQWLDPDFCQRKHIDELHNQVITNGIVSKINVLNGGSGYTFLNLSFKSDPVCYRVAESSAYVKNGEVIAVVVVDPGRGFDNTPDYTQTSTIGSSGVELEAIIDFNFHVTHLGFNAISAEEYVSVNPDSTELADTIDNLSINYLLQVGGYTDKRILNLEIDGDYSSGFVQIPENSYEIILDRNTPIKQEFYSGVKIEKIEGRGYIVDGYNLDSKFFNFLRPSTSGKQTGVDIGNVEVIKHLNWRNEVSRIPYRTTIVKRQDLYQFLLGLGKYYETLGFDTFTQWEVEARAAIEWTLGNDTSPFYVNGILNSLVYQQGSKGVVQTIDVNYDGVSNLLDQNYKNIRRNEMLVLRDETKTEISLKSGEDRLFGVGIRVVEFEHVISIDNVSVFNDAFYVPELGQGQNRVRFSGERTRNWNGRVEAPGYLVQDRGLLLNFESSVRELETDWVSSEGKILEKLTRQTAGFNVGYLKPTYMSNMFISDKTSYRYELGERKYQGTQEAIAAMSRNKNIFGEEFMQEIYEDWMIRLGDYGDVSQRNPLEFQIDKNKIKGDPQHFRFSDEFVSDKEDDLVVDITKGSENSISRKLNSPFNVYDVLRLDNTSIQDLEEYQDHIRDAGLPLVNEIDYFLGSIDDISDIYDPTQDYALIPNWTETSAYAQGDRVRRFGKVYQLAINSTGLTNINSDIAVRGSQVFPIVASGQTLILDGFEITFEKFGDRVERNVIEVNGSITSPTVPSGDTLVLDGITVNFIKTTTTTTYSDIVLDGNVSFPQIVNSAGRTFTVGYANDTISSLTNIVVSFDELSPTLSMQVILVTALTAAGVSDPVTFTNQKLSVLEAFRTAYLAAGNSIPSWETVMNNYYDNIPNPELFVNPEYVGTLIAANPAASWRTAAENLIQEDLDLLTDLAGTHSETVTSIIDGRAFFTNAVTFDNDMLVVNNLLDDNITPSNANKNIQSYRLFVKTVGASAIAGGTLVTVAVPTQYVTDTLSTIASKISAAVALAGAPANITASTTGNIITITRGSNNAGYRLGVSTDVDLGFIASDNDVTTQGSTVTGPVPLTLSEVVLAVNNTRISGITAQIFSNRLRLLSTNQILTIGSGTANGDLGLSLGSTTATTTTIRVPIDLSIGDVVTAINAAALLNIPQITATQVEGALLLTSSTTILTIGDGTANNELGLNIGTFESLSTAIQNTFNEDDWTEIADPADFNVWVVDNIGSNPSGFVTQTNFYNVYQLLDFSIGILEACAGSETGDDALIKTDSEHTLRVGDYVFIVNTTSVPSMDGIHQVTGLSGDFGFFIDRYIEEKGFTGKVFPLRSVRFSNSDTAFAALNDTDYVSSTGGLKTRTRLYVDEILNENSISLGYGGVYQLIRTEIGAGLTLERIETGKTNNSEILNGYLFDNESDKTILQYEVYDPLKGIIPGIAAKEIDLRSDVDLSYYNNSTDSEKELRLENTWGQLQVGTVWWDLSNAIYLNYDQGPTTYRQQYWGTLFPTATIDVYEWTKSPVTPDEYVNAVQAGTVIDGTELTGIPYSFEDQFGELQYNWCEEIELNPNTNQIETYYYFWVKNKTTTPSLEREYSVLQLAEIIQDPSTQDINWIAATDENTLLVSGLSKALGYDNLTFQVNFDKNESDYHQEFILLSEDDESIIPEWLHISLRDSLAGFTQAYEDLEFTLWASGITYNPNSIVKSGTGKFYRCHITSLNNNPDSDTNNDYWTLLELIEENPNGDFNVVDKVRLSKPQNIPDLRLHPYVRYGLETRPHQIWFKDISDARMSIIEKLNDQLGKINLVNSDIPYQEVFEKTFEKGGIQFDITRYWNFVDWSIDNQTFIDRGVGDYFVDNFSDLNLLTPNENEIAQVENSNDIDNRNRRRVYRFENNEWTLIYKERATIKFNNLLWKNSESQAGWDQIGWDTVEWDRRVGDVVVEIFDDIYNKIFIQEFRYLYTELWFHMARHVLREQSRVDWIFKSSYFRVIIDDPIEKIYNKYFSSNFEDYITYVESVKPFHSKLRDVIVKSSANDNADLTTLDTLEFRVQTNPVDDTVDETNTRSFRLSVGRDGSHYSSQIVDEHKVLLGLDIGPDDLLIPILNTGIGTLTASSGAFWINGERIEYTGISAEVTGIGSGFTSGFSSGFSGVSILTGVTRGTQGTLARSHSFADIIEDETGFELIENINLSTYGDTILPAWNVLGRGLLDPVNLDANALTIRANGFGTIDPYGNVLYAKWLIEQETAEAIQAFQNELQEFIEVYWAQNGPWPTGDLTHITADSLDPSADQNGGYESL